MVIEQKQMNQNYNYQIARLTIISADLTRKVENIQMTVAKLRGGEVEADREGGGWFPSQATRNSRGVSKIEGKEEETSKTGG